MRGELAFHSLLFFCPASNSPTQLSPVASSQTYATKDAFRTPSFLLLSQTSQCLFAHGSKDFVSPSPSETSSLIFCIAFDQSTKAGDAHSLLESRLYSSKDWFEKDNAVVDLGIGNRESGERIGWVGSGEQVRGRCVEGGFGGRRRRKWWWGGWRSDATVR